MPGDCLENNVLKMRFDVDTHDKEIKSLATGVADVRCKIGRISSTLTHIQYTAYGALGFFIVDHLGFLSAVKLAIG